MTASAELARYVLDTSFEEIPAPVLRSAKLLALDTIGCMLGAMRTQPGRAVLDIVRETGGTGGVSVLGTSLRVPASAAAWANGRLGNVLDMDECYKVQGHHAQASLAAALATAESRGTSGKELLVAFTMGFEVGVRMGNFLSPRVVLDDGGRVKGWTGLVGPGQGVNAACAATARLLDLDADTLSNAFGNCAQYMVGRDWSRQWGRDVDLGTIKYADTGWNAQGGMMAAWHARGGVRGIRNIFDTDSYAQVFQGATLDRDALLRDLGSAWYTPETSIKFWPCCRWIHYALTAFDQVLREHGIAAQEVESAELRSFPMIPYPRFASQDRPPNLVAAGFSFPHAAAMIALGVPAGPDWFKDINVGSTAAERLRRRISLGIDPRGYEEQAWGLEEGVLKVPSSAIVHARGKTFEADCVYAYGDSWEGAPVFGEEELLEKFRRLAAPPADPDDRHHEAVESVIGKVLAIDELPDVRELTAALRSLRLGGGEQQ
jgi:2-methylcitrate dehydratase PrpD